LRSRPCWRSTKVTTGSLTSMLFLFANVSRSFSLARVRVGLVQFNRMFKRVFGQSPTEFASISRVRYLYVPDKIASCVRRERYSCWDVRAAICVPRLAAARRRDFPERTALPL
jgi:hypothetical protein